MKFFSGKSFSLAALLCMLLATCSGASASKMARNWNVMVFPASLNQAGVINLVGGQVQILPVAIQIGKEEMARSDLHELLLTFDLPEQMSVVESKGAYKLAVAAREVKAGRTVLSYKARILNKDFSGSVGSRAQSEGKTQSFFVKAPAAVAANHAYIEISLSNGKSTLKKRWPLALATLGAPAKKPRQTVIGLWDYDLNRAALASDGLADLFSRVGVNFIEKGDGAFADAMKAGGVRVGGYVHHSVFYQPQFSDIAVDGKALDGAHACPQDISLLPMDEKVPGADALAKSALLDGMATMDYEPTGFAGFCDAAVRAFKEANKVSDEDFAYFRRQLAEHSYLAFRLDDPRFSRIYAQWMQFRGRQTADYLGRLRHSLQQRMPDARLAVTVRGSYADDSEQTAALGVNNAALARSADVIMPQLYMGYGGAAVRALMQWTGGWRQVLNQEKLSTQLWPVLLVRYAGASAANSPERMRQQMLASLAAGANGVLFYYPSNMDALYWKALARASAEVADYEDFYQNGERVDQQFKPAGMSGGSENFKMWPGLEVKIANPEWALTAHRREGRTLLTLFNLKEKDKSDFAVSLPAGTKVVAMKNAVAVQGGGWQVAARDVGFVILESPHP